MREKRQVRCNEQAVKYACLFAHDLGKVECIAAGLHGTGVVVHNRLVQFVAPSTLFVPNIGIGMSAPLSPVVALDVTQKLAIELINIKDEDDTAAP